MGGPGRFGGGVDAEELRGLLRGGELRARGEGDGIVGEGFDGPVEVFASEGVEVEVGRGVEEVDGVGSAFVDGELDGIALVAEGGGETAGVAFDAFCERAGGWGEGGMEALVVGQVGIVGGDADVRADDEAAVVGGPGDFLLENHAEAAGVVVGGEEIVAGGDAMDVAPAAAVDGLEPGGKSGVVEDGLPVEGVLQVAEHALVAMGELFLRQEGGAWDGDTEALGEGVVEELVVRGPPEGVVNDGGAVEGGVLEEGAVEGDLVGDSVDDDAPLGCLVETGGALGDEFGADVFVAAGAVVVACVAAGVDGCDEGAGEAVFGPEEDSDFFHGEDSLEGVGPWLADALSEYGNAWGGVDF